MSLTVPVPLTEEERATLEAQAESQGVSVGWLLRKAVLELLSSEQAGKPPLTAAESDQVFEEIADMIPESVPVLSGQAVSRESIYAREDEWNRNPR